MCGIFGYYNFKVARDRRAILELLFTGLRRLEYRGYDSAGISIDADELVELVAAAAAADPLPTPLRPIAVRQASYDGSLPLSPARPDDSAAVPFANGKPAAPVQWRSSANGLPPISRTANGSAGGSPGEGLPAVNGAVANGHDAHDGVAAALSRRSSARGRRSGRW